MPRLAMVASGTPSSCRPQRVIAAAAPTQRIKFNQARAGQPAMCHKRTSQASQGVLTDLAVMMTTKFLPGSSNSLMLASREGRHGHIAQDF
jgi:hypothetical protein